MLNIKVEERETEREEGRKLIVSWCIRKKYIVREESEPYNNINKNNYYKNGLSGGL